MWKQNISLIIALILAAFTRSIYIPLTGQLPRCTIIYSVGQAETVKLDLNFPNIPGDNADQYYIITWTNTENQQQFSQTIRNGRFKRQLSLTQNVIYDLCIQAYVGQDIGILHIQYNAHNLFAVNQAEVKVPANLLKSSDITDSFLSAENIEKNLNAFMDIQNNKSQTHTNKISQRLVQISILQLAVIIGAGCFQFWMLWKYLKQKQYL